MLRVNCQDMDYNLYAYCGGDPVNLCDTTGQAAKYSIFIFTIKEFETESKKLAIDIQKALKDATNDDETVDDYKSFRDWWNNLGYRDIVIINSHGTTNELSIDKKGTLFLTSTRVSDFLKKQDVKLLVLLGCNSGHFNYDNNLARAFANKITGKVVASDGTVYTIKGGNYTEIWFESRVDEEFSGLAVDKTGYYRPNYGWLVYVGTNMTRYSARIYYMGGTGYMELTVGTIANFIKYPAFYNSFK